MRIECIGYIEDETGTITAYVFINLDNLQIVAITVASVISTLKDGKKIIGISLKDNKIVFSNGNDRRNYIKYIPATNSSGMYINYLGITAVNEKVLLRKEYINGNEVAGYSVINPIGEEKKIDINGIITGRIKVINARIEKGKISKLYDDIDTVEMTSVVKNKKESKIGVSDKAEINRIQRAVRPVSAGKSRLSEIDKKCGMTVIEKFTSACMAVKSIRPYYYSAITCLTLTETVDIDTMAVSINRFFINPQFIIDIQKEELTFIIMHEISHVIMMHNSRRMNRDPEIWNIACDFYVNKFVMEDVGISEPYGTVNIDKLSGGGSVKITMPKEGLYFDDLDLDKDTPEKIYEDLAKNMHNKNSSSQEDGGNAQGNEQGNSEDNSNGQGGGQGNKQGTGNKGKEIAKAAEGKKSDGDIVEDERTEKMTQAQKKQSQKSFNRRVKQVAIQTGAKDIGKDAGGIERELEKTLVEKIDWKKVLRNMLSIRYEKLNSYSSPDRRFISRGMIIPGPKLYEEIGVTSVSMYMDTSGSISNEDLYRDIKQAEDLMKSYGATGTLYFWDTEVYGPNEIEKIEDLKRLKPVGGGGTALDCVFEQEIKKMHDKKNTQSDIILIWTDGYFSLHDEERYKKLFGKKTVFIIDESNNNFKEPFGKKAFTKK